MENLIEQTVSRNVEDEMRQSYLDYAMSVIIGRALPDVRDGLKPVHRRVLYTMHELANRHNKPYKKSARVVGDVLGKYHPHGDAAVYDTLVRMAQDFSMRYPLVDGQGNFGSLDGDPPAAMRYTEVRMARIAEETLQDIDKETVDFQPNYDDTTREPSVLPTRIPNLLVNGSSGIAVGMATNIPPHNLAEVIDGLTALIDDPGVKPRELFAKIPGPDFPTAGLIYGAQGIREAYETGRGVIRMRARAMIETKKRTEEQAIVITEIPYMVNKADLVTQIAGLIRDKKLEGASDVRDESSREGLRVVVSLKRGAVGEILLNQLYASTRMEASFGIQLLAIDEGQPRLMPLRDLLQRFLDFRREVVTRRTRFELRKAEERLHILEGLVKALDNLDAVIELIRKAKTPDEARAALSKRFKFTTPQAQAILDMRLQRLTGLERQKIVDEHKETRKEIARLKEILDSTKVLMKVIRDELQEIRKTYANERRTEIVAERVELSIEDLIVEEDVVITCSHAGYIKRTPLTTYRRQHRGGKGRIGMTTREEDFVEHLFVCSTHDYLLVFTEKGRVYWLKGYEIPQVSPAARGKPIVQLLKMSKEDKLAALLKVSEFEEGKFIISCTESGVIKKTALKRYSNPRSGGIIAQKLRPGDRIIGVELTDGARDIFIATAQGKAIRFPEKDARDMGRVATGVRGVRLRKNDKVVDMATISRGRGTVLTVCERGYGKRTEVDEYRLQGRGGQGVINIRTSERNGEVVGSKYVGDEDELMIITERGKIIRTRIKPIRTLGRSTQGMRLIELGEDDGVVAVAHVAEHVEEEGGGEPPAEPTDGKGPALIEPEKEGETPQG
ncbi:MAG: DNA gyrase subunit A [Acidobacteriota bacterium]|nr:MAG: DNA gyrase subunit A [Acidobacteriota bacterium]